MILRRAGVAILFLAGAACGGKDAASPVVAPIVTTTTTARMEQGHTISRATEHAVIECGRDAGSRALGNAAINGDLNTLQAAQDSCDRARDLLDIDARGERGPTPINQMRLLISHRLVLMALAAVEISGGGVAGDELLLTANKWSEDFRAAMWLLA